MVLKKSEKKKKKLPEKKLMLRTSLNIQDKIILTHLKYSE